MVRLRLECDCMADKSRERKPLEFMLSHKHDFDGYINISVKNQERPDFVYRLDKHIVGIEHIVWAMGAGSQIPEASITI